MREFFGERLLEQRRERTVGAGVMLGTVHGSKGAEHDHVIVRDGGWQLRGSDSWEQLRRLYYVAMTRARQTLTLIQCAPDGAPWLPALRGDAIHRSRSMAAMAGPGPRLHYELLSQAGLYLAFAGRAANHEAIEQSLHHLAAGDDLSMVPTEHGVFLQTADGVRVGPLPKVRLCDGARCCRRCSACAWLLSWSAGAPTRGWTIGTSCVAMRGRW